MGYKEHIDSFLEGYKVSHFFAFELIPKIWGRYNNSRSNRCNEYRGYEYHDSIVRIIDLVIWNVEEGRNVLTDEVN